MQSDRKLIIENGYYKSTATTLRKETRKVLGAEQSKKLKT